MTEELGTIAVLTPAMPKEPGRYGMLAETRVSLDDFRQRFDELVGDLATAFDSYKDVGSYHLDSIDVALTVSAEGKIGLWGSGVTAGAESGISVHFARRDAKE